MLGTCSKQRNLAAAQHPIRILVVDDEPGIRSLLDEYLCQRGFEVVTAACTRSARERLAESPATLVVVDLAMPGEDGFGLVRCLRENFDVGIIMLTAADDIDDRIIGLDNGADDYMVKPFDPRELLARIKSLLRRLPQRPPTKCAQVAAPERAQRVPVGQCTLDIDSRQLFSASGEQIPLTSMEFDLLQTLIAHSNRPLTRNQLMTFAHQREWQPLDRSIDVRITRLRRKIELNPAVPRVIKTIHGHGYLFVPSATD